MSKPILPKAVPLYVLVVFLLISGGVLTGYRHIVNDVPWLPGAKRQIWSVEAKVEFNALGDAVTAAVAVPMSQPGFKLVGEHTASPGYGLAFNETDNNRYAQWSIRCLLYTSPSPRDLSTSRMPSSA